jgi:DNA polymerase I-like protein with 3'-5' exonuclease and polymerase domains
MQYGNIAGLDPLCALDTETTGLRWWDRDAPYLISFCDQHGHRAAVQWKVWPKTRRVVVDSADLPILRQVLSDPKRTWVFQNGHFDVPMLSAVGLKIGGRVEEVMFQLQALNNLEPTKALKPVAKKYLAYPDDDQKELHSATISARAQAKKRGFMLGPAVQADYWMCPELALKYAFGDAERTILLYLGFKGLLKNEELEHVYEEEMELWPVTLAMMQRGVKLDMAQNDLEILAMEKQRDVNLAQLIKLAPLVENLNSSKQLIAEFERRGLDTGKKTKGGQMSMASKDLIKLESSSEPFLQSLFKYRAACDALSDFFLKYRELVSWNEKEQVHLLHPSFQQCGPRTGRFSCRAPNMQNVGNALTTRSSEPIQARRPFGPRLGYVWIHSDYEQLEVRIFADVAEEDFMLDAILNDRDLHDECTNKAWGGKGNSAAIRSAIHALELDGAHTTGESREAVLQALDDLNPPTSLPAEIATMWLHEFDFNIVAAEKSLGKKNSRAKAKMLLFLKIFGGGANAASDLIGCSYSEAVQFLKDYDTAFPRIRTYIDTLSAEARQYGYITNRFGRKLRIDADKPYKAVNYMVQGSAASLLKNRMVACEKLIADWRSRLGKRVYLVLSIHDEIVFECKASHLEHWMIRSIKTTMEDHSGNFNIPTTCGVDLTYGNWTQKKAWSDPTMGERNYQN